MTRVEMCVMIPRNWSIISALHLLLAMLWNKVTSVFTYKAVVLVLCQVCLVFSWHNLLYKLTFICREIIIKLFFIPDMEAMNKDYILNWIYLCMLSMKMPVTSSTSGQMHHILFLVKKKSSCNIYVNPVNLLNFCNIYFSSFLILPTSCPTAPL